MLNINTINMDYKIYINYEYKLFDGSILIPGVYNVLSDDREYDKNPTIAIIECNYGIVDVPIDDFGIWSKITNGCYAVFEDFSPDFLNKNIDVSQMLSDLEALRPYDVTVNEYINGCENIDWDGFESVKDAWQTAVLHDWSNKFISQKKLNEIFIKVMKSNYY